MSDFWSSPDAAFYAGRVGKNAGLQEGYQRGYNEASAAAQQKVTEQAQQIARLQAKLRESEELMNGLIIFAGAAADVLDKTTENETAHFAISYTHRLEDAMKAGHLQLSPETDPRFATRLPRTAKLIRDALQVCLKAHDYPSPSP